MAVTQAGHVTVDLQTNLINALDLSNVVDALSRTATVTLGSGTGANQANQVFHDRRTLALSTGETLDLSGGLTNGLGQTCTFTKVKILWILAATTNVNDVVVSVPAANGFVSPFNAAADAVKVKPGGMLLLVAPDANGYGVTADTADLLTVTNGGAGTAVTYDVILVGVG